MGLVPVLGAVGDEGSSPAADGGPLGGAFGVIDQLVEAETNSDRKSKLREVGEAMAGLGFDVAGERDRDRGGARGRARLIVVVGSLAQYEASRDPVDVLNGLPHVSGGRGWMSPR
jgi:hypothetical protein